MENTVNSGEKYCYFRDDKRRPLITICMISDGKNYGYGYAICSNLDNPSKTIGRRIAKQRAIHALTKGDREIFPNVFFYNRPINRWDTRAIIYNIYYLRTKDASNFFLEILLTAPEEAEEYWNYLPLNMRPYPKEG